MNAPIRYLSVCSGIEAWNVACEGLGYQAAAFSEIDPFASAVLAHRFGSNLPGEAPSQGAPPNLGDFTRLIDDEALRASLGHVDLLVGGTPCQAFSFAGKRLSLADARGNLTLAFAVLAHELVRHGLRNAVWENVPGCLGTDDNAFGCFLAALVGADAPLIPSPKPAGERGNEHWTFSRKLGGLRPAWPHAGLVAGPRARAAWRLLDAQYFGLAQRRERVLLVVDLGGGADPAAVLFEPQGLRGNPPPRREKGQGPAGTLAGGARSRGGYSHDDIPLTQVAFGGANGSAAIEVATARNAHSGGRYDFESETFVAEVARPVLAGGHANNPLDENLVAQSGSEALIAFDTTQITSATNRCNPQPGDPCHPLAASAHPPALAYRTSGNSGAWETGDKVDALTTGTDRTSHLIAYGISADALDRSGEGADRSAAARPGLGISEDLSPTLKATRLNAVAYSIMPQNSGKDFKAREVDVAQPLMAGGPVGGNQGGDYVLQAGATQWRVRRLTPTECARLQGFPDGWSRIPWRGKPAEHCPDGPQYKTYGNSMATKKMRWLARRLAQHMPERVA